MMYAVEETLKNELNELTKEKKDLTNLGLYLAKIEKESALKILYWLLIAIEKKWIEKEINLNKPKKINKKPYSHTIVSRLIENPHYLSKEILDKIAKTTKIDFNYRPYKHYSLKEMMVKIPGDTTNQESQFYNQIEVARKVLETIYYFTTNSTMNINPTMKTILLHTLKEEEIKVELKEIILKILNSNRTPHIKYEDRIILELQKRALRKEKEERILTQKDLLYFQKAIQPKLEKKEIKL